ncbi:MAG TPA: carbonic anhydrase family protein [Xanthomonadales bacterium]|nr:carbonic anhydrase family protein [Xanthomonadales bacterium]
MKLNTVVCKTFNAALCGAVLLGLPIATLAADAPAPRTDRVLTQEQQAALTPDAVVEILVQGNGRYVTNDRTVRDHSALIRDAVGGQYPKAAILSCLDSRIPVEDVFDLGIGDLFVARVAGNFENTDILGSLEYATMVSGSKVVLVLGHENCGAIRAAIDNVELGNITAMLENIKPAVATVIESGYEGEPASANPEFVHLVAAENVRLTIRNIREKSPIMNEMEQTGKLSIIGGLYDLKTGEVELLD